MLVSLLLLEHAHLLDNPPQPEAVDMQEVDDEVSIPAALVVEEGAGQSLGGEASGHLAKGDDEDQVLLGDRYKRSRPSSPVAAEMRRLLVLGRKLRVFLLLSLVLLRMDGKG